MNDNFIIIKHLKKVSVTKPVIVEGLPGVGNVARIAVDFLIEKLKAEKWMTIYSNYFPNSAFIDEDKMISLPKMEFYVHRSKSRAKEDFVFVVGDTQPAEEKASYNFSQKIIDLCSDLSPKEIVTLGGISSKLSLKNPPVFGAVTEKAYIPKLQKAGVRFDREGSIVLVGVAGLMLGLGKLKGIDGYALLAETSGNPQSLGLDAVESILKIISKNYNLEIDIKDLHKNVDRISRTPLQTKTKPRENVTKLLPSGEKPSLGYIG